MPELPEVETISRELYPKLKGKSFQSIEVCAVKSFIGNQRLILGQKIVDVRRRAKLIIFGLADGVFLLIHLKMTGQLIWQSQKIRNWKLEIENSADKAVIGGHPDKAYNRQSQLPHQYTRIIFQLSDGSHLFFNDLRRFGWAKVIQGKDALASQLANLGLEPLDRSFSPEKLGELIKKYPGKKIKDFLQDQRWVAGIGNIYSSEILFCAGVLPERKLADIKPVEISRLYDCIKKILLAAIRLKGTSVSDYQRPDGARGGYLDQAWVYQRAGKKCKKCQSIIKRQKLGSRSAFFCPDCQK